MNESLSVCSRFFNPKIHIDIVSKRTNVANARNAIGQRRDRERRRGASGGHCQVGRCRRAAGEQVRRDAGAARQRQTRAAQRLALRDRGLCADRRPVAQFNGLFCFVWWKLNEFVGWGGVFACVDDVFLLLLLLLLLLFCRMVKFYVVARIGMDRVVIIMVWNISKSMGSELCVNC
jgi:hypothetical protein